MTAIRGSRLVATGVLLAVALPLAAQPPQPPAQQPPAAPAPAQPPAKEPPPAPTVITPAGHVDPATLAEKTVYFEMRDKPWMSVLEWLSNETGLPVITVAKPTGSFSYYGNPKKKYTIPEIIDILNEALLNNKYVLIRRDASFTIVPADLQIDPTVVPRVRPEELKLRGNTEIVSTVVQLNSLVAEDVAPEVRKMMGPFGEVTALTRSNQLVLQDSAKTLRRVTDDLAKMEDSEKGQNSSYAHECKYIKARDAERILKELLGDPAAMLRQITQAQQQQQQQQQQQGGQRQPAPAAPPMKIRMFYISVDDRLGSVIVTGSADKIAQARSILEKIDQAQPGQKPLAKGPPEFRNYTTAAGAADQVAKWLQDYYKSNTAVRIAAVNSNTVMVHAGPEDHLEVVRLIRGADAKANETQVLPLTVRDPEKVATTLKGMFQDIKTGAGPFIEADAANSAVIVRGSAEQVADVKAALNAMGEAGATGSGNVKVISLDRGSAAALAAELQRLMNQMRANPVKVIAPDKPAESKPLPPSPGGNGGGQDPAPQLTDPRQPKPGTGEPVNITVIGNKLIITSNDPQALALTQELARLLTQTPAGEGDFEIIRLKNANATDAARVIDEAFNGPRGGSNQQQQQPFGFAFGGPFGGRFGGGQQQQAAPRADAKVRIIADPTSNSLLVKASPIDMLSIRRIIRESIDSTDDIRAIAKAHVIGPLKAAKAPDVAEVIREVYRDAMNSNSPTASGGRGGGGFFPFGGGMPPAQRITDANGNPRPAALTVSADESTNTLVVHCSDALFKDVDTLVQQLEKAAAGSPRSIRVVSVAGIDPAQLQQALDFLQGGNNDNRNSIGNFGFGGGFGGGNRGGGGRGGNRGGRGGGRFNNRAPDREAGGGPDFFEARVKDDPVAATKDVASNSQLFDPAAAIAYAGEEQQAPPAPLGGQTPPIRAEDIRAPRAPVDIEAIEGLGALIIRADNQADLEEVLKVIRYLQEEAKKSVVELRLVALKHADATNLVATLNQVYSRVIVSPSGNISLPLSQQQEQRPTRTTNPFFGAFTTQTEGAVSVLLVPLARFNSILVGAPVSRIADVIKEIERLDQPNAPGARPVSFALKKAAASRVAGQVQNFYATRYPNETDAQNQIRVTHDDATNTVFVQAAPADLAEIKDLIERIDGSVSSAVNDLRIIPLRNALAEELATILLRAITQGVVAPSATPAPARGGDIDFGFGGGRRNQPTAAPQQPAGAAGLTTKTTTLRFYGRPGPGGVVESGLLEDVHITPEARSNSLIISAPPRTMELLAALIRDLDVVSSARAEMKIFTLRKGDAQQTAALIQQLFLGGAAAQPRPAGQPGAAPGVQQPGAATGAAGSRPLLSLSGQPAEGATLIDLRVTVDDRTNSVIIAGSRNDLDVIEAVIGKLEDSAAQTRRNEVYKLRNAAAADVANALQNFLANSLTVLRTANQLTAYQELLRDVVIWPEPISNSLLISATPQYFDEVMRIITQLDELPPQVVIQVLVADVALTNTEEFGVEIGLQSPILFQRSILPGGTTVNVSNTPQSALPGFNFNNNNQPPNTTLLPNSQLVGESIVGFQGLGNLGVGRVGANNVGGLVFSAASDTFSLLIRALKLQGRVDILSRPQVMTLDNQTAAVNIGQEFPIVTGTVINAQGFAQNTIDRRPVGVLLRVTPRITPDGKVLLRVFPEVSSVVQPPVNLGNGQLSNAINIQQVETTVAVGDGETVVIGGLINTIDNKQENKIPGLGDLPWVGAAFRYRTQTRTKRELLVILTPHIVRSDADARRILQEEARRMDWVIGDVCKVHGPGGLEAILPPPNGQGACAPATPLPVLNGPFVGDGPVETVPAPAMPPTLPAPQPALPQLPPPQPQPVNPPVPAPYVPGQPIRPGGAKAPANSGVVPASHSQPAGKPPAPPPGKDPKPWVFRRDW